jgi:hypothetical protein
MRKGLRSLGLTLAVVLAGTLAVATPAHATVSTTIFSGTLAPGATLTKGWNNLTSNAVYQVGLSPVGASTSAACEFEVTNQYYERKSTGQRTLWWTVKNIGSIACGTNMIVSRLAGSTIASTGGVEPSEIKTFSVMLNQIGQLGEVPLVGVTPSGATSSNTCKFKVRRAWFYRTRSGDVAQPLYLNYEVQNVGNIACSADAQVGYANAEFNFSSKSVSAGASTSSTALSAEPTTATYLLALSPVEIGCTLEITRQWYRQIVNANGTTARQFSWTMKNLGTSTCSAVRVGAPI